MKIEKKVYSMELKLLKKKIRWGRRRLIFKNLLFFYTIFIGDLNIINILKYLDIIYLLLSYFGKGFKQSENIQSITIRWKKQLR